MLGAAPIGPTHESVTGPIVTVAAERPHPPPTAIARNATAPHAPPARPPTARLLPPRPDSPYNTSEGPP